MLNDIVISDHLTRLPTAMEAVLDELLWTFNHAIAGAEVSQQIYKILSVANEVDSTHRKIAHDAIKKRQGWSAKMLKNVIKEQRIAEGKTGKYQQLSFANFPNKKIIKNSIRLYDTFENTRHLLKEYGIVINYNVIMKNDIIAIPSENSNKESILTETIIGLIKLNELPQTNIINRIAAIAQENPINPVVEHLSSLEYKGEGYIQQLANHVIVESETEHIRDKIFRMWMIMACAAADYAESTSNEEAIAKFDSVMIFVGAQGLKKTQFFKAMLPELLRQYFNDGVLINPTDRDSVSECFQWWIIEAGEIDALFKKADIGRFKAFLSKSIDVFRKPYERAARKYQRRTAFVGSANEREFLKDYTGNRRYWPLLVKKLVIPTDENIINNAWAEAWCNYQNGETWWADEEFEKVLLGQVGSFQISLTGEPVEDAIRILIIKANGVFACDIVRSIDIRNELKSDILSEYNIEKVPSVQTIGRIMKQGNLGTNMKTSRIKYWIIRNNEKYAKMRNVDVDRYYNNFHSSSTR